MIIKFDKILDDVRENDAVDITGKQDTLVSGTNIKTINGSSILGSGDLSITTTSTWGSITGILSSQTDLQTALDLKLNTSTALTTFLKLDQTTPQTVINGTPIFNVGLKSNALIDINLNTVAGPALLTGTGLRVQGADNTTVRIATSSFGTGGTNAFASRHARNTAASPQAVQNGDQLISLEGWGYGTTGYSVSPKVMFRGYAAETWTDSVQGSKISIWTTPIGSIVPAERFKISDAGVINIPNLTASKVVFTDASKNLTSTGIGTSAQFIKGDGSLDSTTYVPTSTTVNTLVLSGNIVIKPSNIPMETLVGTPTYSTLNDFMNSFGSAGRKTGGVATDAGSSKVAITAGTGFIKATDDDNTQLLPFNWSAPANITIPADSSRYIGVEYNGGSPQIVTKTSSTWDYDTEFPLARVVNDTINSIETLYVVNTPWWVTDGMTNVIQAIRSFGLVRRDEYEGGLMLSATGTRNIAVSAGKVWAALNDISFAGLDTSVSGTFEYYWYSSTGGWQSSDATQYSVLQYNDVSQATLQNLSANKYANVWVYGEMTDSTISIALLYPQAQYNTAAEAESKSAPDNVPAHISQLGMLLGRYIIKQGVATPVATQSVFTTKFSTSVVTLHSNLGNLGWTSSGHTGTASTIAGFAAATGAAAEYTLSGTGTQLALTNSPVFTTPNIGTATGSASFNLLLSGGTLTGSLAIEHADGLVLGKDVAGGSSNIAGKIKMFSSGDDAFYNTFTSGDNTANATYTLPVALPVVTGYVLSCTDAGVMSWVAQGAGAGDMVLADVQSVTGLKTFDKDKIAMKGTSTGVTVISTANTSATSYTATFPTHDFTLDNITTSTTSNGTGFLKANGSVISFDNTTYLPIGGGTLTGNLLFTDNTLDIGASGATRPRTGYFGTSLISPILQAGVATDSIAGTLKIASANGGTATFTYTTAGVTSRDIAIPATSNGTLALGTGTANQIAYWSGTNVLGALDVATYPSLTELSYVKGVSSAVQTQLGNKASTTLSNLASVAINTTLVSDTDNTDALGTTAIAWSDLFLGNGAVIQFNSAPSTADVTLTHSANLLTLDGGNLALGTNSLTLTGSIGATGARATKVWTTDLESTNDITVGGVALATTYAAKSGALTQFVGNGNWKVWYSDGSGDVQELALGGAGTVLTSAGATSAPTFTAPSGGTPRITFSWTCEAVARYVLGGNGTNTLGISGFTVATGTGDGDSAIVSPRWAGNSSLTATVYDKSPEIQAVVKITSSTATNHVAGVIFGGGGTPPSNAGVMTEKHIGFISDTTILYASNANGTTQTLTDISSGLTLTNTYLYRAVQSGSTNVKFYIDGTLKATHTTNLPSGNDNYALAWYVIIDNDTGVTTNRNLVVSNVSVLFNAE